MTYDPKRTAFSRRVGQAIRDARVTRGVSQAELASACGAMQPTVSRWEAGWVIPDLAALLVIRDLLGVSLDDFLAGKTS